MNSATPLGAWMAMKERIFTRLTRSFKEQLGSWFLGFWCSELISDREDTLSWLLCQFDGIPKLRTEKSMILIGRSNFRRTTSVESARRVVRTVLQALISIAR